MTSNNQKYPKEFALQQVFGQAIPICLTNRNFEIIEANDAYWSFWGRPDNQNVPIKCYESRPGKLCHTENCPLTQIINGAAEYICKPQKEHNGILRQFIVNAKPLLDDSNQLIGVIEYFHDVTELRQANEKLNKAFYDLEGRAKVLNCLYGISKIVEKKNITTKDILQGTVDLIQLSWQYPEITCVQITQNNQTYKTDNFIETKWVQSQKIIVHGYKSGVIEVYYTEKKSEYFEGPFLEEERKLLNAIAERLGRIIERKKGEIEKVNLIDELQKSLDKVRVLSGMIPICASCKQIRDDKGFWNQIEHYISEHSDAVFSHGICPSCVKKLYPDLYVRIKNKKK